MALATEGYKADSVAVGLRLEDIAFVTDNGMADLSFCANLIFMVSATHGYKGYSLVTSSIIWYVSTVMGGGDHEANRMPIFSATNGYKGDSVCDLLLLLGAAILFFMSMSLSYRMPILLTTDGYKGY
jgi:hypothetical protein